jgi:hypothetical protein
LQAFAILLNHDNNLKIRMYSNMISFKYFKSHRVVSSYMKACTDVPQEFATKYLMIVNGMFGDSFDSITWKP